MTAVPGRRKNNSCLLRIRENCPFRKLRRKRYDVSAATAVSVGQYWGDVSEKPLPPENSKPIGSIYSDSIASGAIYQNAYAADQSRAAVVIPMDMDFSSSCSPLSNTRHVDQQRERSLTAYPVDTGMELDAGIDPETGERAQG